MNPIPNFLEQGGVPGGNLEEEGAGKITFPRTPIRGDLRGLVSFL
jgi:hypothetical protein